MQLETLQTLHEQRIDGENLNETLSRLQQEGSLHTLTEKPETQEPNTDISYGQEIVIPRYKLLQPSCQIEGVTPGHFFNTVTKEEVEELEDVVFLTRQDNRSLFNDGDFSGERRCCSFDGYTPARNTYRSGVCETRKWETGICMPNGTMEEPARGV